MLRAKTTVTDVHDSASNFPRTQTRAEFAERETRLARGGATRFPPLLLPVGRAARTFDRLFYPHECLDVLSQESSYVSRVRYQSLGNTRY